MICIALTQGDLRGCGPELCAAALERYAAHPTIRLRLCGDMAVRGPVRDLPDAAIGARSAHCVRDAVALTLRGDADAIVTAPINKTRWHAAGIDVPGHTELLAECVDALSPPLTTMCFWSPTLCVTLATVHLPLMQVSGALTPVRVERVVRHTHEFLARLLHRAPRLACLGLNPHAGEHGLLGSEDDRIIAPALERCRAGNIAIDGPFPADTFFSHRRGNYDAVIAMYHDQGLIPIKTLEPQRAVNVTLGLPFLRVSPGHGTAEDRAGTGVRPWRTEGEAPSALPMEGATQAPGIDPANFFAAIDTAAHFVEQMRRP